MRSIRNHTYIRAVFLALGVLMAVLAVLALTSDSPERVSLTALAAVVSGCSFALVPFIPRLVKWEDSGGETWKRTSE